MSNNLGKIGNYTIVKVIKPTDKEYQKELKKIMRPMDPIDCPCKGTGLIPCPDEEAICRAPLASEKLRYN